ncbi:MAG TPA: hypothetical protein VFX98_05015 [Longimicrobiaceae bacterium]|nr:hypothetical protein [Longimicrobiaceae bacterium]
MNATLADTRFVQVPAELISSVRRALAADRAPLEAVTLLRQVGYELGDAVFEGLSGRLARDYAGVEALTLEPAEFWRSAGGFFAELGWGTVEHRDLHPGVGALDLAEWIESGADGGPAGCHVSTGIFTSVLGRLAGSEVVVMEVPRGSAGSRLLFGSGEALGAVYESLRGGASLDDALAALA